MCSAKYDANSFDSLNELESIRFNVPMYAGSAGLDGVRKMFGEVIENARDEATPCHAEFIAGTRKKSKVTATMEFFPDGSVSIEDDGRGLPVGINEKTGQRACYLAFEKKHAGGKLRNMGSTSYENSIGVHGVGLTFVNACSKWVNVVIKREGKIYELQYKNGGSERIDVHEVGKCSKDDTGTKIHFLYDSEVINPIHNERGMLDYPFVMEEIKEYVTDLVVYSENFEALLKWDTGEIELDEEGNPVNSDTEKGKKGDIDINSTDFSIKTLVEKHTQNGNVYEFYEENPEEEYKIRIFYGFTDSFANRISLSTVNSLKMIFGSSFQKAFEDEVFKYFENILKARKKLKDGYELTKNEVVNKLNFVISLNTTKRDFANQAKNSFSNDRITMVLRDTFKTILANLPTEEVSNVINNILFEYNEKIKQVEKYEKERDKKLPRKNKREIQEAMSKKFKNCENGKNLRKLNRVWFLEGDSAGNGFESGRDKKTDAYIMLKGKPMNVIRNNIQKVIYEGRKKEIVDYEQFTLIRSVVEMGKFDSYIICTDADIDGLHMRNLIIYIFYKYFIDIIKRGQLYIAEAPIYRMKKGTKTEYAFYEVEATEFLKKGFTMEQRFKGLGEMGNGELYRVLMEYNKFVQLSIDDTLNPIEFDGLIFDKEAEEKKINSGMVIKALGGKDASFRRYISRGFMADNLKHYLDNKSKIKKKYLSRVNPMYLNQDGTPMTQNDIDMLEVERMNMEKGVGEDEVDISILED